ncbi:MAG: flagellar protein FlaG [Burkholderiaceae bacterium]|nr:flagellar protein FlaG [Burkholderiaceae bacterium]
MDIGTVSSLSASTPGMSSVNQSQSASQQVVNAQVSSAPVQTANAVQQAAMTPSLDQVKQAVQEINNSMRNNSHALEFSVDNDSERTVVKVVDKQTQKVIRQIPSEEALAIAKSLDQALGKLIQQKA